MTRLALSFLTAALLTTACNDSGRDTTPADSPITLASSYDDAVAGNDQRTFELGRTMDLVASMPVDPAPEGDVVLELFGPSGVAVTRYHQPVVDGRVVFVMPIAGTHIESARQYGSYAVIVSAGGEVLAQTALEFVAPTRAPAGSGAGSFSMEVAQ